MDELIRLSKIIDSAGSKQNPLFDFTIDIGDERAGLEHRLYNKIVTGQFLSDGDAARDFYGTAQPDHRYRMLKSRLKQKLLNHLFFLDLRSPFATLASQYESDCINLLGQGKRLLSFGEMQLTEKLVNKALKMATEAEFTELAIFCYKMLRSIYSQELKSSALDRVLEELEHFRQIEILEEESNDMFEPLRLKLTRSSHSLRSHLSQAEEALPRLEKCWQLGKSYKLFENYYVLNIWYHRMSGKYSELQQFLEKTEKETKPNPIRFNQKRFQLAKVKNLFDLGLFAETIKYAELYVRDFDRFSDGWYEVMRYYFLAANFARKFELSRELLQRAFINQHFDHLPDKEKILWHLFKAYFQVVVDRSRSLEAINLPLSPESMDEGFVLSHLILQYLFYTSPRNESKINEVQLHIEDIKLRYFKNQFGTRTKTFIKLISKTTELSLEKEDELQSKTKYLSRKLMEASDRADIYSDLEIMPYELLWERLSEFA